MKKKINARLNTEKTNISNTDPEISKHFSELGKKSWMKRKQAILDSKADNVSE